VAAAIAAAYLPVIWSLAVLSRTDKYYGYLALVVPVFALMVWASRDLRRGFAGRRRGLGLPVVLTGVVMLVLGHATASLPLQSLSLVVAAVGVAVWLRGTDWARSAAYPLTFLLLLVPVPRAVFDAVTLDVQRFLTRSAGTILAATGIPVRLEEVAILLPDITLQIVEACNGLRFLMGLVVLVTGTAGILVPSLWRRLLLIALIVPVGISANVVRITGTGLAAYWFGAGAAEGTAHEIMSKAVWIATLVSLGGLAWCLGRARDLPAVIRRDAPIPSR
jgi:exosortase